MGSEENLGPQRGQACAFPPRKNEQRNKRNCGRCDPAVLQLAIRVNRRPKSNANESSFFDFAFHDPVHISAKIAPIKPLSDASKTTTEIASATD